MISARATQGIEGWDGDDGSLQVSRSAFVRAVLPFEGR